MSLDTHQRKILVIASLTLALAVILGAFGAHMLKERLSAYQLGIFKTGIQYHFYHGLAMLLLASLDRIINTKKLLSITYILLGGIILFSGSLYLLAMRELLHIQHWKFLGPLTPIGGVLFIIAWISLAFYALKQK